MPVRLYDKQNSPETMKQITELLENGGVIIAPTDTVYALCCHALKERAVERICRIKGIDPRKNRLSIVCYDISSITLYAKIDNATFKLMKRNLPGPFTFLLNATSHLPNIFRNRREVGVRMPDNPVIREIARALDAPLMCSSLPYDRNDDIEYLTNPELIEEKWGHAVDLVIDGGVGGTEVSTIVDCTGREAEIVREGAGFLQGI